MRFMMASSRLSFCFCSTAGFSSTLCNSLLLWTRAANSLNSCVAFAVSSLWSITTSAKARAYRPATAAILASVLSQVAGEFAHQLLVRFLADLNLLLRQIDRQIGGISSQLAAGSVGRQRDFLLGRLHNAPALFFHRCRHAALLGASVLFSLTLHLGNFHVQAGE